MKTASLNKRLKASAVFALALVIFVTFYGCKPNNGKPESTIEPTSRNEEESMEKYSGEYSADTGALGGVDALGRALSISGKEVDETKKVGIFYFLWLGAHGTAGPYDNNKIVQNDPSAILSENNWRKAGGGNVGEMHFWGEPLFGYYRSNDKWVIRKHCQMLTDAGVDYICFDATNGYPYIETVKVLIEVWYEYLEAGKNIPKICFYTNTNSGATINQIYRSIYKSKALHNKYERLDELWFYYEGKPLIIGNIDDTLSTKAKDYFRIKAAVWPNAEKHDDGIPWMEFWRLNTSDAVYGVDGKKEVMNVSIAQHCATCRMSFGAWYGSSDHTRSWHDGENDKSEDAINYGYNFQEQWDFAIENDPDMVFVTGWNEWAAQRQNTDDNRIVFVDCCDPNTSRDAEPMRGGFGDNYFMQLCENIRRYKGVQNRVNASENKTVKTLSDFDNVPATYFDYRNDIVSRNHQGFGTIRYKDESGRNDFVTLKVTKDSENIYFYAETENDISEADEKWMTLFINSGSAGTEKWENQFDFAVNFGEIGAIVKYDGTKFVKVSETAVNIDGNRLMLSVPRKLLGCEGPVDLQFKWADNYLLTDDGNPDVYSFYTSGDAAPIGRFTYVFSEI